MPPKRGRPVTKTTDNGKRPRTRGPVRSRGAAVQNTVTDSIAVQPRSTTVTIPGAQVTSEITPQAHSGTPSIPQGHVEALVQKVSQSLTASLQQMVHDAVHSTLANTNHASKSATSNDTAQSTETSVGLPQTISSDTNQIQVPTSQEVTGNSASELTSTITVNETSKSMTIPMSSSLPLHAKINANIKNKICNNEYIELGQLLHPDRWDQYNMSLSANTAGHTLSLAPQNRKIRSIDQWISAFNIYAAIYLDKFAGEAMTMLKYIETVRRLAQKGGNFISYDENVRYMRQIHSPPPAWDHFQAELYVEATTSVAPRYHNAYNSNSRLQSKPRIPTNNLKHPVGSCFTFHDGKPCYGCRYSHACYQCNTGNHPASRCYKSKSVNDTRSFLTKNQPSSNLGGKGNAGTPLRKSTPPTT